jgi:hypothetical protein
LCAKERIFVYKLDSFVGFIGDEQLHAQECYVGNPDMELPSLNRVVAFGLGEDSIPLG